MKSKCLDFLGFGMYYIYPSGKVWSNYTGKYISQRLRNGYYSVTLWNGKQKSFNLHRLLALCFLNAVGGKNYVNHKDGNKLNNKIDNLEWVTPCENTRHSFDNDLQKGKRGENSHFSKLTMSDVLTIKDMLNCGIRQKDIAILFNISQANVSDIKTGKKWHKAILELNDD